jgi:hypothetical protein
MLTKVVVTGMVVGVVVLVALLVLACWALKDLEDIESDIEHDE